MEIFVWPHTQQDHFIRRQFVGAQLVCQQSFLLAEFEFANKNTRQVPSLFFAERWVGCNVVHSLIERLFVFGMELFCSAGAFAGLQKFKLTAG